MTRSLLLAAVLASSLCAQTVLPGLGKSVSEYTQVYGPPKNSGEGFLDASEQVWLVRRKSVIKDLELELRVFFRGGKSVEERWIRPGQERWSKEELWQILDGKKTEFVMQQRTNPLLAPFNVLQSANTLINFMPADGQLAAQLQNTLRGPQIRIATRAWAQAMIDMGVASTAREAGRAGRSIEGRRPPAWAGNSLANLVAPLQPKGADGNDKIWQTRTGLGKLIIGSTRKGSRLELVVPAPSAAKEARDVLKNKAALGTYAALAPLREALSESFRRFHSLANSAVPNLIANPEWSAAHTEGTFTDEVLQDLISFGKMPDEFSLLDWKSREGETWTLSVSATGYRLTVFWPKGREP